MKTRISFKNSISVITFALYFTIVNSSCSSGNAQSTVSSIGSGEAQVVIEHMAYNPSSITVEKGTKVKWTDNQGMIPHTVTSDLKDLFDSGVMHKKDTFSFVFNEVGTYTYYCKHHKDMHGTVIVK